MITFGSCPWLISLFPLIPFSSSGNQSFNFLLIDHDFSIITFLTNTFPSSFPLNSGLLLIFSNWKKMKMNSGKIDVVDFFIHRIWRFVPNFLSNYLPLHEFLFTKFKWKILSLRIWPAYLATIGLAIVLPLIGSGPMWPQAVESTAKLCRESWWYNILFINNFQKSDELCLYHTWYMSAAMQFHVMGGILLYLIYRYAGIKN